MFVPQDRVQVSPYCPDGLGGLGVPGGLGVSTVLMVLVFLMVLVVLVFLMVLVVLMGKVNAKLSDIKILQQPFTTNNP